MDPLLNTVLRHQIYLEGLKNRRNSDFFVTVGQMGQNLRRDFGLVQFDTLGQLTKTELNELLVSLKKTALTVFDAYLNDLIRWLTDYVHVDYEFWKFVYPLVDGVNNLKFQTDLLSEQETEQEVNETPMGANGIIWLAFVKQNLNLQLNSILQLIVMGSVNNSTKQETLNNLIGSKDARFNDGLLAKIVRQTNAASDTVLQHIAANLSSNIAKFAFDEYQWISILDSGTTEICRSRSGLIYRYSIGPIPPAHVGCRSTTRPVPAAGPLADMPDFKLWAQSQSDAFRNDAFDGGVPSSYAGSKPLTLQEFAAKRPIIVS